MNALAIVRPEAEDSWGDVLPHDIAVRNFLEPIVRHMQGEGATEVWINRPGVLMLDVRGTTRTVAEPALTYQALEALANAVAVYAQQSVGHKHPLLSATLPDGERIQIVLPPAVEPGTVSITIRIPGSDVLALDSYAQSGAFADFLWAEPELPPEKKGLLSALDSELLRDLADGDLHQFLVRAVRGRKTIAVVGDTGSGKTTLMKSLCQYIPDHERLVTIEDVRELFLPGHQNRVHLLYSKGGQSEAAIAPRDLIGSCMRMTPSRVLLAELRGAEAWDFLKLLTTGHAGSITSYHAESCALAYERFMFMAKENPESGGLSRQELQNLVSLTVDVVLHMTRAEVRGSDGRISGVRRYVTEVHFDPVQKLAARFGSKAVRRGGRAA